MSTSDEDKGTRWEFFEVVEELGSKAAVLSQLCSSIRHGSRFDEECKYQLVLPPGAMRDLALEGLASVLQSLEILEESLTVLAYGNVSELGATVPKDKLS